MTDAHEFGDAEIHRRRVGRRRAMLEDLLRRVEGAAAGASDAPPFACPCCGCPMLTARGAGQICDVCNWEDDGSDDPHADRPSAANAPYTLAQAREAFRRYGAMYPPQDDPRIGGADDEVELQAKRRIVGVWDRVDAETTADELRTVRGFVRENLEILEARLKRKIAAYEARERRRADRTE